MRWAVCGLVLMVAYDCDCVMNALATDPQVADATRSCSKAVNARF